MVNIKNNVNRILDYKNNRTQKDYSAKLNEMYGNNPFLDRNGKIFNEYVDYQKVLDNPNATAAAKNYITQATGLSPSQNAKKSTYTAAPKTDYDYIFGAFSANRTERFCRRYAVIGHRKRQQPC